MNKKIIENEIIERIASHFSTPPHRINNIHESDAELVNIGVENEKCLAITTDAIVEEVSTGLYEDPFLIGWMLATVNLSDLAAVGADPLGLLVSVNYPSNTEKTYISKLSVGISEACKNADTFILGGDTNQGDTLFFSGCALGLVPANSIITRIGAKPGDKCYLSGSAGMGSLYAFLKLSHKTDLLSTLNYRPRARIQEGIIIRQFASCCMDTSDGVIHTVDTLMRLNHIQILLYDHWKKILHAAVLDVCNSENVPPWIMLAGVHGEFELFFTIPPDQENSFLQEAEKINWTPICIGEIQRGEGVAVQTDHKKIFIDTGFIRNLSDTVGSDPQNYIHQLLKIAEKVNL